MSALFAIETRNGRIHTGRIANSERDDIIKLMQGRGNFVTIPVYMVRNIRNLPDIVTVAEADPE